MDLGEAHQEEVAQVRVSNLALLVLCFLIFALPGWALREVPAPEGYINDFAGVLSASEKAEFVSLVEGLEQRHGDELALVITSALPEGFADTRDFAQGLFDNWGVGKAGLDNGVIVVLCIGERRVEIITGYGVEGVLPDIFCTRLLEEYAVPHFKDDDWYSGLAALMPALVEVLETGEEWKPSGWDRFKEGLSNVCGCLVALLMAGVFLWGFLVGPLFYWIRGVRCSHCKTRMKRNKAESTATRFLYECPSCGATKRVSRKQYLDDYSPLAHSFYSGSGSGSGGGGGGGFGGGSSGGGGGGASF